MKQGFTIIEVSILFVFFLIVAFLVAPLSIDDTMQAGYTSQWRRVQGDFANIFHSVKSQYENENTSFKEALETVVSNEIKSTSKKYNVNFMNGFSAAEPYKFDNYRVTRSNAVISFKLFDKPQDDLMGYLLYDVNGTKKPNTWGKDVFGLNIYADRFEPFCKTETFSKQKQDCSKHGSGLCCSNYYLIGGNFD